MYVSSIIDIASLNGKSFSCVERCLGRTKLNDAIADAFAKADAGANPAVLNQTPYVNKGPYFKVASYYDGETVNEDQDGNRTDCGSW